MNNNKKLIYVISLAIALLLPLTGNAGVTEEEVLQKLDLIRSIKVVSDEEKIKYYNSELDKTWRYFKDNEIEVLPILKKQIEIEANKSNPNHFLLLDVGYFLMLSGGPDYVDTAKKVFYKIHHHESVVSANLKQLFEFSYRISATGDPDILPYLDSAFLSRKGDEIFIPQHAMRLGRGLMNVFLYGVYGPKSEEHLQALLQQNIKSNPELSRFIVELLIWIGTEKSIPQVMQLMETQRDYDTFARCLAYFMSIGGKAGQQIMLDIDVGKYDAKTRQYYENTKEALRKPSFEGYQKIFARMPGEQNLKNSVVKTRLEAMYENYGKDDETHPLAILNADLPKEYLIEQLVRIRSRMFHRLSDEALSDVKVTNALLNALRYKDN